MSETPNTTTPLLRLSVRGGLLLLDTPEGWRLAFLAPDNVRDIGEVGLDPHTYNTLAEAVMTAAALLMKLDVLTETEIFGDADE